MKKLLRVFVLVAFVALVSTTVVNATVNDDLLAELSKTYTIAGKSVSMTAADKVRVERYLSEHTVTEAQKDTVLAKLNAIIDIMNAEGVSDVAKLSEAKKQNAINLAKEGASALNLTLVADTVSNTVKVYDNNGKLVESAKVVDGKLAYTGSNSIVYVVVSAVALIAVATVVVSRKKVNA